MVEIKSELPDQLCFNKDESELLGHTADAISAWMGKPVLAQIIDATETGFEWVIFAIPLLPKQSTTDLTTVNLGGKNARIIGNSGGLILKQQDEYVCEFLWAIQLSDIEGVRYIKIGPDGEEIAWANNLREMLPFDVSDEEKNAPA